MDKQESIHFHLDTCSTFVAFLRNLLVAILGDGPLDYLDFWSDTTCCPSVFMQIIQHQFLENGRPIWLIILQRQESLKNYLPQFIAMVPCQLLIQFTEITDVKR